MRLKGWLVFPLYNFARIQGYLLNSNHSYTCSPSNEQRNCQKNFKKVKKMDNEEDMRTHTPGTTGKLCHCGTIIRLYIVVTRMRHNYVKQWMYQA
jgi:hypothetical protein